ncbi:conserved hypothetical protein [Dehalogenimonas lykanthroporepellens BL-DC-9]|nr:conserved hypothetical protein [Dehalogenimonas lykanthroporepellens BL-DC-9]
MRRGCISLGNIKCNACGRDINYPERYLVVDEKDGQEVEKGDQVRYCVECALAKGYAHYYEDKGERTLTFMP